MHFQPIIRIIISCTHTHKLFLCVSLSLARSLPLFLSLSRCHLRFWLVECAIIVDPCPSLTVINVFVYIPFFFTRPLVFVNYIIVNFFGENRFIVSNSNVTLAPLYIDFGVSSISWPLSNIATCSVFLALLFSLAVCVYVGFFLLSSPMWF